MPSKILTAVVCLVASCGSSHAQSTTDGGGNVDEIRNVLLAQQAAWNEGDYEGFMDGYWRSDSLTFASGGTFNKGWQTTLDNYKIRYPNRAAMGILTFTLFEIKLLSETDAFVFGRFELEREKDRPNGVFTLLLKKFGEDWKVVFDHTSAEFPQRPTQRQD
jgi:ketosteroid isomerase-like protein